MQWLAKRSVWNSAIRWNAAQDKEIYEIRRLLEKKIAQLKEEEVKEQAERMKPRISHFTRPILQTFVIALASFYTLNLVWTSLETKKREEELKTELHEEEEILNRAIASAPALQSSERKSHDKKWWWSRIWKS